MISSKTYIFNNFIYINSTNPVFINNAIITTEISIMGKNRFTSFETHINRHITIHKYITSSNIFSDPVIYHSVHIATIGKAAKIFALNLFSFACHITIAQIGEISDILPHKIICIFGKKPRNRIVYV